MKAKLIIEDKEIEVEISEEEYKKLHPSEEKKTGYERVEESDIYYYTHSIGYVETDCEDYYNIDNEYYESANYYSDKTVAENNDLEATFTFVGRVFGIIYFDSEEAVNTAIDEFHDELIWYFTEYKDSL